MEVTLAQALYRHNHVSIQDHGILLPAMSGISHHQQASGHIKKWARGTDRTVSNRQSATQTLELFPLIPSNEVSSNRRRSSSRSPNSHGFGGNFVSLRHTQAPNLALEGPSGQSSDLRRSRSRSRGSDSGEGGVSNSNR